MVAAGGCLRVLCGPCAVVEVAGAGFVLVAAPAPLRGSCGVLNGPRCARAALMPSARRRALRLTLGVRERRTGPLERSESPRGAGERSRGASVTPVGRSHRLGRARGLLVRQGRDVWVTPLGPVYGSESWALGPLDAPGLPSRTGHPTREALCSHYTRGLAGGGVLVPGSALSRCSARQLFLTGPRCTLDSVL